MESAVWMGIFVIIKGIMVRNCFDTGERKTKIKTKTKTNPGGGIEQGECTLLITWNLDYRETLR